MTENHLQMTADQQHRVETFAPMPPSTMKILGIAGQAGSGKDTVADKLIQMAAPYYPAYRTAFAYQLKAMLAAAGYPCPATQEQKNAPYEDIGVSWRHMAQQLGGMWRDAVDPLIFVKGTMSRLAEAEKSGYPLAVVTDVRYPHEVAALKAVGAQILHINGPENGMTHASEQKLPIQPGDLVINNVLRTPNSLQELQEEVVYLWSILCIRWKL